MMFESNFIFFIVFYHSFPLSKLYLNSHITKVKNKNKNKNKSFINWFLKNGLDF